MQPITSLYRRFAVPRHIRQHMQNVARVSVFLAKRIKANGYPVDTGLVRRAALLHDLFRIVDISRDRYEAFAGNKAARRRWDLLRHRYRGVSHNEVAHRYFQKNEPVLANVVRAHAYSCITDMGKKPGTWEEKIVSYADKCVAHDRIIGLRQRLEEGHKRYPGKTYTDKLYFALEKELFKAAGIMVLPARFLKQA